MGSPLEVINERNKNRQIPRNIDPNDNLEHIFEIMEVLKIFNELLDGPNNLTSSHPYIHSYIHIPLGIQYTAHIFGLRYKNVFPLFKYKKTWICMKIFDK